METNKEFERDWQSLAPVLAGAATLKEICELMWLKGRCAGMDHGMKHFAPPARELVNSVSELIDSVSASGARVL
jgi:hypothetical protein